MLDELIIDINDDGSMECLFTELIDLAEFGIGTLTRVSELDMDENGAWWAMVYGGPTLGPYRTRSGAAEGEVAFLQERMKSGSSLKSVVEKKVI
jgi:hypothetical protein